MSDWRPGAETPSSSPEETRAVGAVLARLLRPGDIVLLAGDLGAGKTTFTQGLAAAMGVRDQVTSPTFTLVRPYPCASGDVRTLLHADLYRLDHLAEVRDLALDELVEDGAVAVVEWGDVGAPVLDPDALMVSIDTAADDSRRVSVAFPAGRDEDAAAFERALAGAASSRAGA